MANRKISDFTALTAPASSDVLAIIDISESAAADKNKKITYANLLSKAPDGSAAAPSISFNSDQDSGLSGGSNTLTFSTGGTARLTISSAGLVTIPGDLTVSGTTTTIDSTTLTVKDKNIEIAKGNGNDAAVDGAGITIDSTDGDKTWNWVDATDAWTSSEHIHLADNKNLILGTGSDVTLYHSGTGGVTIKSTVAQTGIGQAASQLAYIRNSNDTTNVLSALSFPFGAQDRGAAIYAQYKGTTGKGDLIFAPDYNTESVRIAENSDVTFAGNIDIASAKVLKVNGTQVLSATQYTGNAATASTVTNITVADESSDTSCNVVFTTAATGSLPPKTGTNLTFNSSSGVLTATGFAGDLTGDLTGNVTGNTSGSSGSCTGNAATATALATARTIGGVSFDGSANINLPGVNAAGNQNTSGNAATATTATTATTSTNVTVADESSDTSCNVLYVTGATGDLPPKSGTNLTFNSSSGVLTATGFAGALTGNVTGNVTGNTSGSSGSCTGNAATATEATNVTVSANNSTDETVYPVFVDGATGTQGAETDTGLTYNPSSGLLTSTSFAGALTGNVTGNASGSSGSCTGNAATATALATARAINGVNFDGSAAITVTAAAGTLTGNTLASGVTASSLTSVGTLTGLTVSGNILMSGTGAIDLPTGTTAQRPGSADTGMFRYNSTTGEFEGYTASGWGAIAGSGGGSTNTDFQYLALRNAANNGAASYPGADFTLVTSGTTSAITPTAANALLVSYGGVIQQPNTGTSTPTTGFAISGSTIKFGSNIAAAPDFIIYQKNAGIGTPSDETVTEAKLDANAPTNDYVLTADSTAGSGFKWAATGVPTSITVAAESTDTSCSLLFATAASGNLAPKTATTLTFNSNTGALTATSFVGALTGNVTGNASGSSGSCTGNAATATTSGHVTVTDNESTNENNLIPFVEDAASSTGSHGLEMDGDFHYNPSTGTVTATAFAGSGANLTGIASTSLDGCGYQNDQTISSGTYTIASGKGMHSVGPITNNGTVTVNGVWIIS